MQQPMTGAPMPPMGMSDGGRVPGGNSQVFREFMRRNFGTPQGIAANVGLVGGALLGGPIGAGIGGNLGTYVGQQLTPPAKPLTPFEMMRGGLRAPEGGAVGGGGGGGLPYGGPTSYASERSQLNNLINQFGDRKRPTVTVEEIPQGMYQGGQVPYRMQEGRSVPDFLNSLTPNFILEAQQANRERMAGVIPNRANEQDVVAQAKALAQSGRVEEAAALLRDAGISPAQVIRPPAAVATTPPMEAAVMTRGPLTRGAVSPQVSPAPVASMTPPPMEAAVASQATPAATPPRPRLGTEATSSQVLFPGDTSAAPPAATAQAGARCAVGG